MSRPWQIVLGVILALSVAVEFTLAKGPPEHLWEHKTFFAWYGFLGCVAIILVSKALGKRLLQRPEGYYREEEPRDVG